MQLIARWELLGAFGLTDLFGASALGAVSMCERAAAVPWTLAAAAGRLELAVGPVAWRSGALTEGLEAFHHLRGALAFAVPADRVTVEEVAVRLDLPGGTPDEALVERVGRLAAPLLDPAVEEVGAGAAPRRDPADQRDAVGAAGSDRRDPAGPASRPPAASGQGLPPGLITLAAPGHTDAGTRSIRWPSVCPARGPIR